MMFFKTYRQPFIYFLALILCTQGVTAELTQAPISTHETIENVEIERKIDELLLLIQKRLVIMHEVARTKWNQNLPIEDKMREQQILADLTNKGSQYGLDEKLVTRFFHAQIEASKDIQKNDFSLWKERGIVKFDKVFSLKDELRLYIDRLNHEMLTLLSIIYSQSFEAHSLSILDHPLSTRPSDYIEKSIWLSAISPLKNE